MSAVEKITLTTSTPTPEWCDRCHGSGWSAKVYRLTKDGPVEFGFIRRCFGCDGERDD